MTPIALSFDVTDALPDEVTQGQRLQIACWLFVPPALKRHGDKAVVYSFLNGGTYDKRYFHFQVPGRSGYSLAEHLCGLGNVVVLPDHLGIGDSSRAPVQMRVTRQVAALANHAAMQQLYAGLMAGTLVPGLAALPHLLKVGGGHSMGGMQTITQQAAHRTYERICVLGYTAVGVHLFLNGQAVSADPGPLDPGKPDYPVMDRSRLRASFHWENVPDDVVQVDNDLLVPVPYVLSTQAITSGIVQDDAAAIDVPIYHCLGERDVSPDPWGEMAHFRACRDYTFHLLPQSGHCQNFASTRQVMFDRIDAWTRSLPV